MSEKEVRSSHRHFRRTPDTLVLDSRGIAPRFSACGADVVLLDHEPVERKPWDSNPQSRFFGTAVFGTASSSGRMTSVRAAAAGIEPATKRLTGARPYQHRPHRIKSAQLDLNQLSFWPSTLGSRLFNRRGGNRTHDLRLIRTPLSPLSYAPIRLSRLAIELGRRESNPRLPD